MTDEEIREQVEEEIEQRSPHWLELQRRVREAPRKRVVCSDMPSPRDAPL